MAAANRECVGRALDRMFEQALKTIPSPPNGTRPAFWARLIKLLESHGIEWRAPSTSVPLAREPEPGQLLRPVPSEPFFRRNAGKSV